MAYLYWIHLPEQTDMTYEGYIGVTTRKDVKLRWNAHKRHANDPKRNHVHLYRAFNKYGVENLIFEVLLEGPTEYVFGLENKLRPEEHIGWNSAIGGEIPAAGRKHSDEEKEKRASKLRGKTHTEAARANMSAATKGVPKSEDHKKRMRVPKNLTPEARKRLSDRVKARPPWLHPSANKRVWALADLACIAIHECEAFSVNNLMGFLMTNSIGGTEPIYKKLKAGWIPQEDTAWLAFKDQYEKEQNGTQPV